MRTVAVNCQAPPFSIPLGRQGENLAVQIVFDCTEFAETYGDGRAELLHRQPATGLLYPVAIEQDGSAVTWTITNADTAVSGAGSAELRWYAGDVLAKSVVFRTSVLRALEGTADTEPPEPQQAWVDAVLQAAQDIKSGSMDDEQIAHAVENYLTENPVESSVESVNGKIGTVVLTAVDVGAIATEDLQLATDTALAQAKESGEFDGSDGTDGLSIHYVAAEPTMESEQRGTLDEGYLAYGRAVNINDLVLTSGYRLFRVESHVESSHYVVEHIGSIKGADGYTPVRGTDYWTADDIATIKSYVDDAILGGAW